MITVDKLPYRPTTEALFSCELVEMWYQWMLKRNYAPNSISNKVKDIWHIVKKLFVKHPERFGHLFQPYASLENWKKDSTGEQKVINVRRNADSKSLQVILSLPLSYLLSNLSIIVSSYFILSIILSFISSYLLSHPILSPYLPQSSYLILCPYSSQLSSYPILSHASLHTSILTFSFALRPGWRLELCCPLNKGNNTTNP